MEARAVPGWIRPRDGASLFLALFLCVAAGCGRSAGPGTRPAAGRVAGMGALTPAGRAESVLPPPESSPADSVSAVTYRSLEAARDTVEMLLRRSVDPADTAVHVSRDTVTFARWFARSIARGWVMAYGYAADGPDGTTLGLRSRDLMGLIEGRWDGGDDTDTTYVPVPGCIVTATRVPLGADDVMR